MTGLSAVTLFNLYAEHIMRNARLDELRAGIKIGERIINNLRYPGDITLNAESEEELEIKYQHLLDYRENKGISETSTYLHLLY